MSDELICGCGDGLTEGAECVNYVANYKSKLHDLGLAYENNTFYAMKFRDRIAELEEEVERLLTTMREILEECRNSGRGNEIVNERMFERIELAAWMALGEPKEIDAAIDAAIASTSGKCPIDATSLKTDNYLTRRALGPRNRVRGDLTMTDTITTQSPLKGTSRRAAYVRALPHHWYQRDAALASLRKLRDGSWVATRVLPWATVATIPTPTRQPDMIIAIGYRGAESIVTEG